MSGELDKAKGEIKRAVGELNDDKQTKREGTIDKLSGKAKRAIDSIKRTLGRNR